MNRAEKIRDGVDDEKCVSPKNSFCVDSFKADFSLTFLGDKIV